MEHDPVLERYRRTVARADPRALWELGCDARRFSDATSPGELLSSLQRVTYLYNPANCAAESLEWLEARSLSAHRLDGASHWATVDQPAAVSEAILQILSQWEQESTMR
jgi:pimeloyl-ACP methyl ester carboxylesterase